MNNCKKDMAWTREDKVFVLALTMTVISVFSFIVTNAPSENLSYMVYIYLEISIVVGCFMATIVMEVDKKFQEDKYLKYHILSTSTRIALIVFISMITFVTVLVLTEIKPQLLIPAALVGAYILMFWFVPKIDSINMFIFHKITKQKRFIE